MFNAFRVADKPTHIQFAGGKTGRTHFSSKFKSRGLILRE